MPAAFKKPHQLAITAATLSSALRHPLCSAGHTSKRGPSLPCTELWGCPAQKSSQPARECTSGCFQNFVHPGSDVRSDIGHVNCTKPTSRHLLVYAVRTKTSFVLTCAPVLAATAAGQVQRKFLHHSCGCSKPVWNPEASLRANRHSSLFLELRPFRAPIS